MGTDFKLEGVNDLRKALTSIRGIVDSKVMEDSIKVMAEKLAKRVQSRANSPKLKSAIIAKRFERRISGIANYLVKVNYKVAPFADYVEYGTRGVKKSPFMRPVVKKYARNEFAKDMTKAIERALSRIL
jgi:HK97 gp10 family phage protein